MIYIKLDENMELVTTVSSPIYRGDRANQKITFLIPTEVGDINISTATIYLSYIRADGTADIALLTRTDELYKEKYYQYYLPVTSTLTRYPGEVCAWIQIFAGTASDPTVAKSGECVFNILDSQNMDEYISDRNLRLIYEMQKYMDDKVEKTQKYLTGKIESASDRKADGIALNVADSTIQLVATKTISETTVDEETGEEIVTTTETKTPIGDPVYVRTDSLASSIVGVNINEDGDLVITFGNGDIKNLGKVALK